MVERERLVAEQGESVEVGGPLLVLDRRHAGLEPGDVRLHGDADAIIPIEQGRKLADLAKSLKGAPELVIYPGERHGFGSRIDTENGADALARTIAFLKRELN